MSVYTTLVATLGGQPQVVTFTLDLLLQRGETIDQVVVVYLAASERYQRAFRTLAGEFSGDHYLGRPCKLRPLEVKAGKHSLADAYEPEEVEAVRQTVFGLLAELKAQNQRLHLSLTGGRRILALTALAAAMQHLTPADRLWHIYTPDDLTEQARDGALLHAPAGSGLKLIEVPFVPWTAYFPFLQKLLNYSPSQQPPPTWQSEDDYRRCRQVWDAITPRQQQVLAAFVEGLERKEVAARLKIKLSTLDDHREAILHACSEAWPEERANLTLVQRKFPPFLASFSG